MHMRIPFIEIPEQGMRLRISDPSWLPEEFRESGGAVDVELHLVKKKESRIEVQGDLRVGLTLQCDRCLASYPFDLAGSVQLIVEVPDASRHWRVQDLAVEGAASDLDTLQVNEPVVDLEDILRQQLYLGLPAKQLCREDCRGLCTHCGSNLNIGQCGCHDEQGAASPFAVLAAYKKKKRK